MNILKEVFQEIENPKKILCRVSAIPTMESLLSELRDSFENYTFEVNVPMVALESQQQDEDRKTIIADQVKKEIEESLNRKEETGPLQLFLLDGNGLAGGDTASQATLRALAKASLISPSNVIAAVLPGSEENVDDFHKELPEAVRNVLQSFLEGTGVKSLESKEELFNYLRNR